MLNRLPPLSIDFSGRFERERRHALMWLVVAFALAAAPVAMFLNIREQTRMVQLQRAQLQGNQQPDAGARQDSRLRRRVGRARWITCTRSWRTLGMP